MNIGERVGDYEVIGGLGNGGMGAVYKVRNLLSERVEAMKILLPNLAGDPALAERFLREIKLQASLDHPHIAKLHTAFHDSNQLLMVMEFVEGVSVEKLLAHGALLAHDAVNYARQVLEALAYAHARGVVHRDIKPANLMLTPSGSIKLLDFGIAHMKADYKLTQTGTTLGSLYYIAPELINGGEPDPRCDLYSLGVVLYEMVTGRKPFQGESQYSILAAHMQTTPPAPAEAAPWIAGPLNDVILKAMAKDPADRFQSAEAFKAAMESAAGPAADQAATQVLPVSAASGQNTPPQPPTQAAPATRVAASQPAAAAAPPPQARADHRGLYVALGCVLTLTVLAAAAIETPKFFKTHADQSVSHPAVPVQDRAPDAAPASAPEDKPATTTTAPGANSPAVSPSEGKPAPAANASASGPASAGSSGSNRPAQAQPVAAKNGAQAQDNPQASGPSPEALASFQSQMHELQEQAEHLNIRARTVTSGLNSLKDQMASQGLGLRADIVEAEARMNHLLDKAQRDIASGDAVSAEHDLEKADHAVAFIEKFLGR